jgi:hypothetical protein
VTQKAFLMDGSRMNFYIKIIISILFVIDLYSCTQQQLVKTDIGKAVTKDIKKTDIKNNVGTSLLEVDFDQFLDNIAYDEIQKVEGCCWGIKRQGELLIVLSDKKGLSDLIVRNYEILSSSITFNNKIRTGMAIEKLLEIYPNIELLIDENDYQTEYFSPPALISYKPDGSLDTVVAFEVESETGKPLSNDEHYPTRVFSKQGRISRISVFKW